MVLLTLGDILVIDNIDDGQGEQKLSCHNKYGDEDEKDVFLSLPEDVKIKLGDEIHTSYLDRKNKDNGASPDHLEIAHRNEDGKIEYSTVLWKTKDGKYRLQTPEEREKTAKGNNKIINQILRLPNSR